MRSLQCKTCRHALVTEARASCMVNPLTFEVALITMVSTFLIGLFGTAFLPTATPAALLSRSWHIAGEHSLQPTRMAAAL